MNRHVPPIPAQPPKLQRVAGTGSLHVKSAGGIARIERLYQEGAAKLRLPRRTHGPLEAILINTAGGLTGGDRLDWSVEVGPDAAAVVTTQACEKLYRSGGGRAEVRCALEVGPGARLAWLPQETIVFDGAAFRRDIDASVAPGASALILEATIFGRLARGERVARAEFRDRWRVRVGGRLVHAEDFAVGPSVEATLARRAAAGGRAALATVLAVGEDIERLLPAARDLVGETGGASFWRVGGTGKLLARMVCDDGYALRQRLVPLVGLLNGEAGLPRVWST